MAVRCATLGWMSDVVPPGGDRPVDDVPWPAMVRPVAPAPPRLPGVPAAIPTNVTTPADWRTMDDGGQLSPPGYRLASRRALDGARELNQFGLAACATGVLGLVQLAIVVVPLLAVLALSLGLSGRRYARLDPDRFRLPVLSTVGVALGAAGLVAGLALTLAEYS